MTANATREPPPARPRLRWLLASLLLAWGFAEATLFFVVPDVPLSLVAARRGLRPALPLAILTLTGALLGGTLMVWWGGRDVAGAVAAMEHLPAIGPAMIGRVAEAMRAASWPVALARGGFAGVPYKIYAVEAGAAGLPLAPFLAVSAMARLARFLAAITLAALAGRLLRAWQVPARVSALLVSAFWIVFYAIYWSFPPR